MVELALVPVVAVGLVLFASWRMGRDTRRRERVLVFAAQRGWTFQPTAPELADRWIGYPFGRGEQREVWAVVRGEINGSPFTAFEYTFRVPRESHRRLGSLSPSWTAELALGFLSTERKRYSIVVVHLPTYLPKVVVEPESALDRAAIATAMHQDIELESEDFNRRYRVSAVNPRAASDLLTPRTMELLIQRPPIAFRSEGAHLVSWKAGGIDPLDVLRRASTLDAVADGVPGFVWKDNGVDLPFRGDLPSRFTWPQGPSPSA